MSKVKMNERGAWLKTMKQDWPLIVLIFIAFIASLAVYPQLPEQVPSHWNLQGEVDDYTSRFWGAFLGPVVAAAIYLVMIVLPNIDPRKQNYARFASSYRVLSLSMPVIFLIIHAVAIAVALGYQLNVGLFVQGAVSILLIIIGNELRRVRSTYFVGIKTPWTLADDEVWRKTHRLAAPLWVGAGFTGLGAAFLAPPWNGIIFFGAIMVVTIVPVVYSYLLYARR
jgi:uncharacterized membrane protein